MSKEAVDLAVRAATENIGKAGDVLIKPGDVYGCDAWKAQRAAKAKDNPQ
jgi:hypothetical protein